MKLLYISLSLAVLLSACNVRPKRVDVLGNNSGAIEGPGQKPGNGESKPKMFEDSNDPLDTYLSVGPYLQKEFDSADSANKTVKVYLQIRQENNVEKNISSLKELIGKMHPSIVPALDSALKKGDSTVELEAEIAPLKTSVTMINKAVSGIELSLPSVK